MPATQPSTPATTTAQMTERLEVLDHLADQGDLTWQQMQEMVALSAALGL